MFRTKKKDKEPPQQEWHTITVYFKDGTMHTFHHRRWGEAILLKALLIDGMRFARGEIEVWYPPHMIERIEIREWRE